MKKKLFLLFIVFSMFLIASFTSNVDAMLASELEQKTPVDYAIELRNKEIDSEAELLAITDDAISIDFNTNQATSNVASQNIFTYYGGTKYFLGAKMEFIKFHLRSVGENVEVWVADDLSYGYNRLSDVVTQEQVDSVRDEFENQIYPTNTEFFGQADFHDGTNSLLSTYGVVPNDYYHSSEGKTIILIENIKDQSYYQDTKNFVSGFYWRNIEKYTDRNIITIDSYAWNVRMPNDNANWQSHQYDVFGTIAHEYQHLIHDDNDEKELLWINEGMADFAQYLNGYGHHMNHVNAFLSKPENSLLIWGDYNSSEILADYGQAYLMQLYLHDQFGKEFIRKLATNENQSIESVNEVLREFNTGIDFNELFRRFSIAVAIDSNQPGDGIYEFKSIDLQINYESASNNEKDGIPAFGANYKIIDTNDKIDTINFSALDYLPMKWNIINDPLNSSNQVYWANAGNKMDNFLIMEVDLSQVNQATLLFDSYINIEEQWDYGFVQVSLDEGRTWTSLANENTRNDFVNWDDYPTIGNQLPGYTGRTENYTQERFDLSAYAGNTVHIGFRYMTDATINGNDDTLSGWFIDNIEIPELEVIYDGSSITQFTDLDRLLENHLNYGVSFVNEKTLTNGEKKYKVVNGNYFNASEEDALRLRQLFKEGNNYMIIWYAPYDRDTSMLPFSYEIINK